MSPDVGSMMSPTMRSSVDFPQPEGPISETKSPRACDVLRRAADDELLEDDDAEEEKDAEAGGDHVRRPDVLRLQHVVLVEVDDRAAEPVGDRRRRLADDRADDARGRGDLEG